MKLRHKQKVLGPVERALLSGLAILLWKSQTDRRAPTLGRRLFLSALQCPTWVEGMPIPVSLDFYWGSKGCEIEPHFLPGMQVSHLLHLLSSNRAGTLTLMAIKPSDKRSAEGILVVCVNLTWHKMERKKAEKQRERRAREEEQRGRRRRKKRRKGS